MGLQDKLFDIAKLSVPPKADAPEGEIQRWRWIMFTVLFSLMIGYFGHYSWAAGIPIPWLWGKEAGFVTKQQFTEFSQIAATKDEINDLQKTITEFNRQFTEQRDLQTKSRLNDLHRDMFALAKQRCNAQGEYKSMLTEQINALQNEYTDLKGRNYPIPTCENLR